MTTIEGAIKAVLVGVLGSNRIALDQAPPDATTPYIVIRSPISDPPILRGDRKATWRQRRVQLSVFQAQGAEDDTLISRLIAALDGQVIAGPFTGGSSKAMHLRVNNSQRMPLLAEEQTVHHVIDVMVPHATS